LRHDDPYLAYNVQIVCKLECSHCFKEDGHWQALLKQKLNHNELHISLMGKRWLKHET